MVVNGEVRQPYVSRAEDSALDELRLQHAITALARHVVHPVSRQMDFPGDKPQSTIGLAHTGEDDRTVLIAIPGEQMGLQLIVQAGGDGQPPVPHVGLFIHRMTFSSFNAAVSVSGFSLFDRRET